MRRVEQATQFRRDFKREARSNNAAILSDLLPVLVTLAAGQPLDPKYRDHPLVNSRGDLRDCHIRPDLVLLYRLTADALHLVRLGSHSELGL